MKNFEKGTVVFDSPSNQDQKELKSKSETNKEPITPISTGKNESQTQKSNPKTLEMDSSSIRTLQTLPKLTFDFTSLIFAPKVDELVVNMPTLSLYTRPVPQMYIFPFKSAKRTSFQGWSILEKNIFKSGTTLHSGLQKIAIQRRKKLKESRISEAQQSIRSSRNAQSQDENIRNESQMFLDDLEEETSAGKVFKKKETISPRNKKPLCLLMRVEPQNRQDFLVKKMKNPKGSCVFLSLEYPEPKTIVDNVKKEIIKSTEGRFSRKTRLLLNESPSIEGSRLKSLEVAPEEALGFSLEEFLNSEEKKKKAIVRGFSAFGLGSIYGDTSLKMKRMNCMSVKFFKTESLFMKAKKDVSLLSVIIKRGRKKMIETPVSLKKYSQQQFLKPKYSLMSMLRVSKNKVTSERKPSVIEGNQFNPTSIEEFDIFEDSKRKSLEFKESNRNVLARVLECRRENTVHSETNKEMGPNLMSFNSSFGNSEEGGTAEELKDIKTQAGTLRKHEEIKSIPAQWTVDDKIDLFYFRCGSRESKKGKMLVAPQISKLLSKSPNQKEKARSGSKEPTPDRFFSRENTNGPKDLSSTCTGAQTSWRNRDNLLMEKFKKAFRHKSPLVSHRDPSKKSKKSRDVSSNKKEKNRSPPNTRFRVQSTKNNSIRSKTPVSQSQKSHHMRVYSPRNF